MSSLEKKLSGALSSRDDRKIRRRLPDPTSLLNRPSSPKSDKVPTLIDFNSNDYLSLSTSPKLRALFLQKLHAAPDILGSGGSRLLVNGRAHAALEERLRSFFASLTPGGGKTTEAALLFNSGFDANVGFFSAIPQQGDAIVYDEHIHASVHDGMRASRVSPALRIAFKHNSVSDLRRVLLLLKNANAKHEGDREEGGFGEGKKSIFVSVESLYSMDGTFSPLTAISALIDEVYPAGNAYLVVDEAHSTGIYGPQGRGRVAELGLEDKVLARLHTFGKALAASGAVIVTTELVRDYLLNYARSLIYTTSLSYANIIAADASFDLLVDGTAERLSEHLFNLSTYFITTLRPHLSSLPPHILSLPNHLLSPSSSRSSSLSPPSPIIPLHTSHSSALSTHLRTTLGINARSITWPTVPKGKDRVRVCLHAGNRKEDVDRLVAGVIGWARGVMAQEGFSSSGAGIGEGKDNDDRDGDGGGGGGERGMGDGDIVGTGSGGMRLQQQEVVVRARGWGGSGWVESKL